MKILRLRALNINSLKGKTEIDFIKFLKGNSLFAIIGETGSGKTTILDIISCALYGQTPRLSNPKDLISKGEGEALCEVEFELKGEVYRSSWSIKRARKKADGKIQAPKMELALVKSGEIITDKTRDVPKKIEEITGLDFGRFTQSMMLAQGGFDAFLKAKEKDRSALLEKITGTKIYSQISQKVYENYKRVENELEREKAIIDGIELLDKDKLNEINSTLKELNGKKEALNKDLTLLGKELKTVEEFEKLQNEQKSAKESFVKARESLEQSSDRFKELELAKKALKLEKSYIILKNLKQDIDRKEQNISEIKEKLSKLKSKKITLEYSLKALREYLNKNGKYESLTKDLSLIIELLNSYKRAENELIKSQKQIRDIETDIKRKEQEIKIQSDKLEPIKKEFKKVTSEFERIVKLNQTLEEQEPVLNEQKLEYIELKHFVIEYIDAIKRFKRLDKDLQEFKKEAGYLRELKDKLQKSIESIKAHIKTLKAKIELEVLIKKYEDDRKKLKEGEPCFLCGSREHPLIKEYEKVSPNRSQIELKEQERLLEKVQNEYLSVVAKLEGLNSKISSTQNELNSLESRGKELKRYFKQKEFKVTNDNSKFIENKLNEVEAKLKEISTTRDAKNRVLKHKESIRLKLEREQKRLSDLQNLRALLKEQLKSLQNNQEEFKRGHKELEDKLKSFWSSFGLEFDKSSLYTKLKRLQNLASEYQSAKDKELNLQKEIANLDSKIESQLALQKSSEEELEALKQSRNRQNSIFESELQESGFESVDSFLKVYLSAEEIENLEKFCQSLEQEYKTKEALLKSIEQKLSNFREVDFAKSVLKYYSNMEIGKSVESSFAKKLLQDKEKELKEQLSNTQEEIGRLTQIVDSNSKNQNRVKDKLKKIEVLKKDYEVWIKLNELIGSADGAKFAKFAQGVTLDNLIYLANAHLEVLSDRYYIVRRKEQNHLLELDIVDRYQGNEVRSTHTLSGGESFIISLALALGLSELASQKISIDSLFLDEGFGTLDKDSLEIVLDALSRLESRGKMVGIISHVELLKEYIPLQIKVKKVGGGVSLIEN